MSFPIPIGFCGRTAPTWFDNTIWSSKLRTISNEEQHQCRLRGAGRPLVWSAVTRFEGQLGVYTPGNACRACLFPALPEPGTFPSPEELGVVGAAAGVMGCLEAIEALKLLLGAGESLTEPAAFVGWATCILRRRNVCAEP